MTTVKLYLGHFFGSLCLLKMFRRYRYSFTYMYTWWGMQLIICYLGRLCTCRPWCCEHNCRWEMCWSAEQCSIPRWCCVLQWCHPWVSCCLCLQLHSLFGGSLFERMPEQWKLDWYCSTVCCWLVVNVFSCMCIHNNRCTTSNNNKKIGMISVHGDFHTIFMQWFVVLVS